MSASFADGLPFRAHVQQVHEEVVGQRFGSLGEDAVLSVANVGLQHPQAADERGHFRGGEREQLRLVDQQCFRRHGVFALEVIAEAVGIGFEHSEGFDIGLLLRGVHAAGRERNGHVVAGIFRRLLDAGATAEHDQIGQRNFLAAGRAPLKSLWMPSSTFSTLASWAGWLTSQSFFGARRMRAPLAPPRLSEPRKVDADAQAVETSCEIDRPDARILFLQRRDVFFIDQLDDLPRGSGPAR